MSQKIFGAQSSDLELQPGWNLDISFDQTIRGFCEFICTEAYALGNNIEIGQKHPKDERCELIGYTINGQKQGKCKVTAEYFGLESNPTRAIWSYYNATNEEPIEAHPDFSTFAGSKGNAENGAIFNDDGSFAGFAGTSFAGIRGFLDGKPVLRKTWYADNATSGIDDIMKIKSLSDGAIPGLPSGSNTLKTNWGNNPIGNSFYQLWEEYSISGRNGWNTDLYKNA